MQIVLFYTVPQMKFMALICWDPKNVMCLKEGKKRETCLPCVYSVQTWIYGNLEFLIL